VIGTLLALARLHAADPEQSTPAPPKTAPEQKDWRKLSYRKLEAEAKNLLYSAQYDQLNAIVADLNENQTRFDDGVWKLSAFFEGVSRPRQSDDPEDWKVLFQRLEDWDKQSHGVFTMNAIGRTQLNYAWNIRTASWARDVSEEQWQVFNDGIARSMKTFAATIKEPEKCIDVYEQLLCVGLAQGWPREKMDATLREAISIAPDYYPCYQKFAYYTLERWHGAPGDTRKFLQSILDFVPGEHGYEVYTHTAMTLTGFYGRNFFASDTTGCADWPMMKKGFETIIHNYPSSKRERNFYAAYACLAGDRTTARALYDDLTAKNEIVLDSWKLAGGFETAKKWILESE